MIKEDVVKYLKNKYHPKAIIIYGSYVDGSFDESSDIDVIVIADGVKGYDSELIKGIILDAWIYPTSYFENDYILDHNLQKVYDGDIVFDENGIAKELKKRAIDYINNFVLKTLEEIKQELLWCEKFLQRAERGDGDGYYRWHRLLVDSIKIYCDIKKMYYYDTLQSSRSLIFFCNLTV